MRHLLGIFMLVSLYRLIFHKFDLILCLGRWDSVLTQASTLRLPREKMISLYEQVALELIESREIDLAREVWIHLRYFLKLFMMKLVFENH